jgi:hypothetical protein
MVVREDHTISFAAADVNVTGIVLEPHFGAEAIFWHECIDLHV